MAIANTCEESDNLSFSLSLQFLQADNCHLAQTTIWTSGIEMTISVLNDRLLG